MTSLFESGAYFKNEWINSVRTKQKVSLVEVKCLDEWKWIQNFFLA